MFYISYFYQVRFFDKSILPVSTAIWDPKWFHANGTQAVEFRDKRQVLNGFRYPGLNPAKIYNEGSDCKANCEKSPDNCEFLAKYESMLNNLDFDRVIADLQRYADRYFCKDVVLLVHEAPTNPCSERCKLVKWFNSHGYELPEWSKDLLRTQEVSNDNCEDTR